MSEPFIGEIRVLANSFVPDGWFPCDGRQLSIGQYQALYAVIGTIYGGNGSSYFNLPDLQGVAPAQQGLGSYYRYQIGRPLGEACVTLNAAELPNHTHAATATSAKATSNNPVGRIWAKAKGTSLYATTNDNPVPMNESALGVSGSQTPQAHDNVQPCLGMYFAMAYEGMFPVRP